MRQDIKLLFYCIHSLGDFLFYYLHPEHIQHV